MTQEHDVATLAQEIIDGLSSTFKARNGRDVSIEGDDGEKCWILGNEGYEALIALSAMPAREVTVQEAARVLACYLDATYTGMTYEAAMHLPKRRRIEWAAWLYADDHIRALAGDKP